MVDEKERDDLIHDAVTKMAHGLSPFEAFRWFAGEMTKRIYEFQEGIERQQAEATRER